MTGWNLYIRDTGNVTGWKGIVGGTFIRDMANVTGWNLYIRDMGNVTG